MREVPTPEEGLTSDVIARLRSQIKKVGIPIKGQAIHSIYHLVIVELVSPVRPTHQLIHAFALQSEGPTLVDLYISEGTVKIELVLITIIYIAWILDETLVARYCVQVLRSCSKYAAIVPSAVIPLFIMSLIGKIVLSRRECDLGPY